MYQLLSIASGKASNATIKVGHLASIDLVRIKNGTVKAMNMQQNKNQDIEVSARANGFRRMVEKFGDKVSLVKIIVTSNSSNRAYNIQLPDMDFPINGKAEGRILIPWEHTQYPNLTIQDTSGLYMPRSLFFITLIRSVEVGIEAILGENFTADWRDDGNVWESWRRTCRPDSRARKLFASIKPVGQTVVGTNHLNTQPPTSRDALSRVSSTFVESVDSKYDFCDYPSTHYQQGHFFSDWRTISFLFPVFSPAKAQGYADIRIPSHYYHQATPQYTYGWDIINLKGKEYDDMEVAWENKSDTIFWRGATTGGGNTPSGFAPQYQRHRCVLVFL